MCEYSKFIAPERRSIPTPRHMVKNGKKYILDGMLGMGEDKDLLLLLTQKSPSRQTQADN